MNFDILSEERETQMIRYYCLATNHCRYDFAIIYTELFFGKAIVISIQNGRMVLLCQEDLENPGYWSDKLGIKDEDIKEFQKFFSFILQSKELAEQY
ncbi:SAV0927 family protein [Fictibacillus gelatini]|uniref:SAV0927 family protein n=1 Tax=Fictibacillus gelatini TaxID=225985 RepID=UPI0003FED125|nr:SAV0927 family protein [Fictibacillus gelatini]